jgi:hypothetical protein
MKNSSVKELSKYIKSRKPFTGLKGTPHTQKQQSISMICYLTLTTDVLPISDGEKIKWGYMLNNPYGFETLALRGYQDPPELVAFAAQYLDHNKMFNLTLATSSMTFMQQWVGVHYQKITMQRNSFHLDNSDKFLIINKKVMYGKKQWRGREVEGRYSDLMTFFVRELINNKLDVDKYTTYPHYYFTIEYMKKIHDNDQYLSIIRHILDTTNCVVTIEAE